MRELTASDIAVLDTVSGGMDYSAEVPDIMGWLYTSAASQGFYNNVMMTNVGWTNSGGNFNTFMQTLAGGAAGSRGGLYGVVAGAIVGALSSGTFYA